MLRRFPVLLAALAILICCLPFPASAATISATGTLGENISWYLDSDGHLVVSGYGRMQDYEISKSPLYSHRNAIKSVEIQDGITHIGNYVFQLCTNLNSIELSDTITSIGNCSFQMCSSLFEIDFPDYLLSIGDSCFFNCTKLTSVDFPPSLVSIGIEAFFGCPLVEVNVYGSTPFSLGKSAFNGASTELKINVPSGCASAYKSSPGWTAYAYFIQGEGAGGSVVIPDPEVNYPIITQNLEVAEIKYYQGDACAPLVVMAQSPNGGTISYQWSVWSPDYNLTPMISGATSYSYIPSSEDIGSFYYQVRICNTSPDGTVCFLNSNQAKITILAPAGSGDIADGFDGVNNKLNDLENSIASVDQKVEQIPDQITGSMTDMMDKEKTEAESQGNASAEELIEIIPDDSQGFIDAFGSLVSALSYTGTSAKISMQPVSIPAVSSLFPEIQLLDKQEIDFEYYFSMIPAEVLTIIQALFDAAVVLYCMKEFLGLLGSFVNGFTDIRSEMED